LELSAKILSRFIYCGIYLHSFLYTTHGGWGLGFTGVVGGGEGELVWKAERVESDAVSDVR